MARKLPPARREINRLHRQGWSDARIGRALGRDSSLIGQIRRGKKPGTNLGPALQTLGRKGAQAPAPPARRPQRTRRGAGRSPIGTSQEFRLPPHVRSFLQALRRAAARKRKVQLVAIWAEVRQYGQAFTFTQQDVTLYGAGGWDASSVLQELTGGVIASDDTAAVRAGIERLFRKRRDIQAFKLGESVRLNVFG